MNDIEKIIIILMVISSVAVFFIFLIDQIEEVIFTSNCINKMDSINDPKFNFLDDKIKALVNLNKEISLKFKIPISPMYIVDNNQSQATAVNILFRKAIIWELKLLKELDEASLKSVLAHEIFHIKQRHYLLTFILKAILLFSGLISIILFQINLILEPSFTNSIFKYLVPILSYIGFIQILFVLTDVLLKFVSRLNELSCDKFAVKEVGIEAFHSQASYFLSQEKPQYKKKKNHFLLKLLNTHPSWETRIQKGLNNHKT